MAKLKKYRNVNGANSFAKNKGDILFYCLILIIPIAQILVFYFGVNFQSILMSFQSYSTVNNVFSWDPEANILKFLDEVKTDTFWLMVKDSLIVWLCTQLAGTVLALFFSYYIYKKRTLAKFFKFVLFLPSIIPGLLLVLIFKFFMNSAVPAFMMKDGVLPQGLLTNSRTYFWIITAYTVWVGFGSQVLVYSGAMDQIPTEMLEAGKIDGVTPFGEFIYLIVPYIIPTVTTFVIVGVATIFTNQNNLYSFFGDDLIGTDKTIGYYLYYLVSSSGSGMSKYCYASFLGLVSTCVAVPLTFGVRKVLERWGDR